MTFFVDTTSFSQSGEIRPETSERFEASSNLMSRSPLGLLESLELTEAEKVSMSLSSLADDLAGNLSACDLSAVSPDLRACNRKRAFDDVFDGAIETPSSSSIQLIQPCPLSSHALYPAMPLGRTSDASIGRTIGHAPHAT